MGIFFQYAMASLILSIVLVYIYDHTIGQVVNRGVTGTVRAGIFVGAWTALTAFLGARGFAKAVRGLREKTKGVGDEKNSPLPKDTRIR